MKEIGKSKKKAWTKPRIDTIPFKNTLSGGIVSYSEDATYSVPS